MATLCAPQISLVVLTADDHCYPIDSRWVGQSGLFREMLDTDDENKGSSESSCLLKNILKPQMERVLEFMELHHHTPMPTIPKPLPGQSTLVVLVGNAFSNLVEIPHAELFSLINAAAYLEIQPLLDLACAKMATLIIDKTPEQIRETFGIVNDFTPEEEERARQENLWSTSGL